MKNLISLYHKLLDAQHNVSQAMQSDWPASTRAFRAAETRANRKYCAAVEAYLVRRGVEPTAQNKISLMTKLAMGERMKDRSKGDCTNERMDGC